MTRRAFLVGAAATASMTLLAACGRFNGSRNQQTNNQDGSATREREANVAEFLQPLTIPPLATSTIQAGRRVFELVAQAGTHEILKGKQTSTWGFNGTLLGPTLRARHGEEVAIRIRNELNETTTLHWHGMHLPAAMDGGPHQPIAPGETWEPHWQIRQPAATLWYHPHPHGQTEAHVYRGLAGLFIIDDEESDSLGLPQEYGVDDIPVIVQDKIFARSGEFQLSNRSASGMLGDTILVNGTYAPFLDVTRSMVRLRILNGSTARIYNFGFSDQRDFQLIGTDGGLLAAPHTTDRIQLSPGERAEIVVQLEPGEVTILRSYIPTLGQGVLFGDDYGNNDIFDILQLRAADTLQPSPALPARLAEIEPLHERDAVSTREFRLSGRNINGERMDMSRIDEIVTVDSTEIWTVFSSDFQPHNFHVHDVQFQILTIDGKLPPPELAGWKDTIFLQPGSRYRLIMRFEHYTDPTIPYMYHCHLLFHEDQGMMGQFVVMKPGEEHLVTNHLPHQQAHEH